jgi:hypothetical protein
VQVLQIRWVCLDERVERMMAERRQEMYQNCLVLCDWLNVLWKNERQRCLTS